MNDNLNIIDICNVILWLHIYLSVM